MLQHCQKCYNTVYFTCVSINTSTRIPHCDTVHELFRRRPVCASTSPAAAAGPLGHWRATKKVGKLPTTCLLGFVPVCMEIRIIGPFMYVLETSLQLCNMCKNQQLLLDHSLIIQQCLFGAGLLLRAPAAAAAHLKSARRPCLRPLLPAHWPRGRPPEAGTRVAPLSA